jgi:hypothetical protein
MLGSPRLYLAKHIFWLIDNEAGIQGEPVRL